MYHVDEWSTTEWKAGQGINVEDQRETRQRTDMINCVLRGTKQRKERRVNLDLEDEEFVSCV